MARAGPSLWLLLGWLVPAAALATVGWPVGLFPMLVVTLWVALERRRPGP
jgi:hypothetical protein